MNINIFHGKYEIVKSTLICKCSKEDKKQQSSIFKQFKSFEFFSASIRCRLAIRLSNW